MGGTNHEYIVRDRCGQPCGRLTTVCAYVVVSTENYEDR